MIRISWAGILIGACISCCLCLGWVAAMLEPVSAIPGTATGPESGASDSAMGEARVRAGVPEPGRSRVKPIFEPNRGQAHLASDFLARGNGYWLHLRPAEAVLHISRPPGATSGALRELVMKFGGGKPAAEIEGERPLSGHSNYILGREPGAWISRVPHYSAVRYREAFQGIDLIFSGVSGNLEYDFIIAPHADPARIRLELDGADGVSLDGAGNLILRLGEHEIVHSAPRAFQVLGEGAQIPMHRKAREILDTASELGSVPDKVVTVESRFVIHADEERSLTVGFEVGDYNADQPLVIDPAVGFSTFLGGSEAEEMPHIAVDGQANIYVAGTTYSIDLPQAGAAGPATAQATGTVAPAVPNAFVTKLSSDGSTILYTTYLGGGGVDRANGIVVDDEGNAYLTGQTDSLDFPLQNSMGSELRGPTDAFVTKLSADGAGLVFSSYLGGSGTDAGMALAIDPQHNVYVTGQTSSSDFPTRAAVQGSLGGPSDGFVAKISSAGKEIAYSTYLGGSLSNDGGLGIAVDDAGGAYVSGVTESEDFPLVNAVQTNFGGGGTDAFVSKMDESGATLAYSTYLGGGGAEVGLSIAVDSGGQAYLTGQTTSADFPTFKAFQRVMIAAPDAFLAKLLATGDGLVYSTYLGGGGVEVGSALAVDQSSNVHLVGMTSSTDFPIADALQAQIAGGADAFVLRLDDLGSELSYSTYLGGTGNDAGVGVALDGAGNALVVGQTASADFPLLNPVQGEHHGVQDAFIARFCLALIFERNEPFHSSGGNGDITVTAPDGCVWPAISEVDWISVISGNTGVGSDMVRLQVAPNGTGAPRAGAVRVAGKTVILEQAEATECEYRLSDNSESFYSQGGVGRVRVFTSPDCPWTAVSTVPWITLNSGDTGVGEGTVSYTVTANRTGRQRAANLIIAGQVFTVFDWLRDDSR